MGNGQARLVDRLRPVHEEVEVNRPGAEARPTSLAPERPLDREEALEQLARREVRLDRDGAVQKAGLVAKTDRIRLAKAGDSHQVDVGVGSEERYGAAEIPLPVAEIPAQTYVRAHGLQLR